MTRAPYGKDTIGIEPLESIMEDIPFDCSGKKLYRSPRETKGGVMRQDTYGENCEGGACC